MKHIRLIKLAVLLLITGCGTPLTMKIVDIDGGYKPLAGATISRYPTPHRGEAWTTTAADVQTTDADGKTTFAHGAGRFVIVAPGKASASFYSTFAPQTMELGLGAPPKQ